MAFAPDKDGRTPTRSLRPRRAEPRGWPASKCSCARSACWPYQLRALAFVTFIVVAAMVGSRAALAALRARYPWRLNIAGSLLLLHGFVLVLLAMGGQRGFGTETLTGAVFGTTRWVTTAAIALATVCLLWKVLAERLLTLRHVCGAALVSAAFAAAWVTCSVRPACPSARRLRPTPSGRCCRRCCR